MTIPSKLLFVDDESSDQADRTVSPDLLTSKQADHVGLNFSVQEVADTHEASAIANSSRNRLRKIFNRVFGMDRIFLITVFLPTLISIIYFGFIASDIYISESRFVVRSPEHQASTGLGALFQGAGFSRSQDDTYSVHDY